ncbi:MAG TPA: ABC transporter ATP-binding protein [Candidatus Binataceae bacterium]|jgi:ABC-type polysaccharide/polyol phosphate transport system ATPase subunit
MPHIRINHASLIFRLRQSRRIPIKEWIVRWMFRRSRNPLIEVRALEDLNLQVDDGERIGVIGANGAGKSTLLKLIAGVYQPTSGECDITGQISSLFDLALGFEMDANGWENISFRSYLQGETPRTVASKRQAIADFSELGKFLDMPVRYYSAGMQVRLAFSIATAIEPEILLVDEVLSAGDMAFQQKARARMREMMTRARLMVMVSHDLGSISELCTRAIWLDHGKIRQSGATAEIIAAYKRFMSGNPSRIAAA